MEKNLGPTFSGILPMPLAILALAFARHWSPLPRALLGGAVAAVALIVFQWLARRRGKRIALVALLGFVAAAGASLVCDFLIK